MTTQKELDEAKELLRQKDEQERLDIELAAVQAKLDAHRKKQPPSDIGGQMRWLLDQYGLRTTFYCFIFGMTIILVGLLTPYYAVNWIPGALVFFNAGPVVLFIYGAYRIPIINTFVKKELKNL